MRKCLTITLLLLFAACKKDGKPYIPLNAALKRNYSFKVGSYWIYRDSLTGRVDSFYVTKYSEGNVDGQNNVYESSGMVVSQRNIDNIFSDTAEWNIALFRGNTISLANDQWPSGRHFYASHLAEYPFISSSYVFSYPSITILGIGYSDVTSVSEEDYSTPTVSRGSFYFKDSVGFIKINLRIDTMRSVWELERYHINY